MSEKSKVNTIEMDVVNMIGELIVVAGAAVVIPDLFKTAKKYLKK